MEDEGPSGLLLDDELPLSRLAACLKMAEAEVCRRMVELVAQVRALPSTTGMFAAA